MAIRVLVCFLFITSSAFAQDVSDSTPADTIYLHGNIYTGVAEVSSHAIARAHAMAVAGDRIISIGNDADILKHKTPHTTVIDLHGRFVMPGFNDAHMHLTEAGFKKLTVDLTGVRSLDEFRDRIHKGVQSAGPAEWVTGSGWDETLWPGKKLPTRVDIDEVSPDRPVFVERVDGHVAVVNTLALKLAHVTIASKPPQGGDIGRGDNGQPNGILRESAQSLVTGVIPAPSDQRRRQAIETALREIASLGVTSVQDFSFDSDSASQWRNFQIFEQLEREGKLTARISEWLPFNDPIDLLKQHRAAHPQSDPMLHTGMLKAFMDGSLGSHTAAMLQPYADDPKNSGLPQYDQEKLNAMARERALSGFQLGFHAIGDRGVQMALDAFAEAEAAGRNAGVKAPDGTQDYRFRVEHAQVTNPSEVQEFAERNVIASMQPSHLLTDMRWAESRIGPDRAAHSYAWAEFLNHGVHLAFGTDYPVESVNPFRGIYEAVTRKSEDGKQQYFPEQKLTIDLAIAAYTAGSAYAEFDEKQKGTLASGMFADFVVLDRDITVVSPEKILDTRVLQTVVGGKTVYDAK